MHTPGAMPRGPRGQGGRWHRVGRPYPWALWARGVRGGPPPGRGYPMGGLGGAPPAPGRSRSPYPPGAGGTPPGPPGGVPPWDTPPGHPPGTPRDPPGAHFFGYLITLPVGTKMGHFFGTEFWDKFRGGTKRPTVGRYAGGYFGENGGYIGGTVAPGGWYGGYPGAMVGGMAGGTLGYGGYLGPHRPPLSIPYCIVRRAWAPP